MKECESIRTTYKHKKPPISVKSCKGLSYQVTKDEVFNEVAQKSFVWKVKYKYFSILLTCGMYLWAETCVHVFLYLCICVDVCLHFLLGSKYLLNI